MATVTQSTTVRTLHALDGYPIPATVDQHTDMNDLPTAISVYLRLNGGKVAVDTIIAVMDAMRDSSAVVTLYIGADGGQDARVLWPFSVSLTKDNNITARCYCTLRREIKTFRLDRMIGCHPLTTPDDVEATPDADAAPARDFSTQEGAFAYMQAKEVVQARADGRMPRAMND